MAKKTKKTRTKRPYREPLTDKNRHWLEPAYRAAVEEHDRMVGRHLQARKFARLLRERACDLFMEQHPAAEKFRELAWMTKNVADALCDEAEKALAKRTELSGELQKGKDA